MVCVSFDGRGDQKTIAAASEKSWRDPKLQRTNAIISRLTPSEQKLKKNLDKH